MWTDEAAASAGAGDAPGRPADARAGDAPGAYTLVLADGTRRTVDAVIVTTPAHHAAELVAPLVRTDALTSVPYVSVVSVLLAFDRARLEHPLDGTGFVIPRKEGTTITACTWVSSKWLHTAPDDKALIRCYVGRAGEQEHLRWTDEEIVAKVRDDLHSIMGIGIQPEWTKVIHWKQSMPQYLVGHLDRLSSLEAELDQKTPGLIITGAGYYGLGVPDCIVHGQKAAQRIADAFYHHP
jgi:oxygen-dependent protoporphyrinogen oxidase